MSSSGWGSLGKLSFWHLHLEAHVVVVALHMLTLCKKDAFGLDVVEVVVLQVEVGEGGDFFLVLLARFVLAFAVLGLVGVGA